MGHGSKNKIVYAASEGYRKIVFVLACTRPGSHTLSSNDEESGTGYVVQVENVVAVRGDIGL